jgi:hypothetical protein
MLTTVATATTHITAPATAPARIIGADGRRQRRPALAAFFLSLRPKSLPPEILEPIGRQLGVTHRMLNVSMTEIGLQGPRIVALRARAKPQAWRSICGWLLNPRPAAAPARSTRRVKPAVVNGEPRSDVNTNGDLGSCSRCRHNLVTYRMPYPPNIPKWHPMNDGLSPPRLGPFRVPRARPAH